MNKVIIEMSSCNYCGVFCLGFAKHLDYGVIGYAVRRQHDISKLILPFGYTYGSVTKSYDIQSKTESGLVHC